MSHLRSVVLAHVKDSLCVLVAGTEPCISLATQEQLAASGRKFRVVTPAELDGLSLPKSWVLAVVLCPGDDTKLAAAWVKRERLAAARVHFYFHPDTNPRQALQAWKEAGLGIASTWTVKRWQDLHPHLGAHWNNQVHDDFCHSDRCPLR